MTMAPPAESHSGEPEKLPSWAFPPEGGFTAEDLDRIPELPPHTELIDGNLVFVSPQARFHMLVNRLLEMTLLQITPPGYEVVREMTLTLEGPEGPQRPEPDVMVVRSDAASSMGQTTYRPEDAVLVVETVSPGSRVIDRRRKPLLYAESGIPHMWRVENENDEPVVYTFELEPVTRVYIATGVHRERLKTSVPFDIDIDLSEIRRR